MDPRKLSTEELVRLCLETRDEDLWTEFVRRFQRVIAGVIIKCLSSRLWRIDHALVADLTGDTFLKICKDNFKILHNFEFRHENALYGFLKVMAAHVVEDHFRKQKIKEVDLDETTPDSSNLFDKLDQRRKIEKIESCLQQLAGKPNYERDHKMFWLRNREGLTAEEILEFPDMGFKTVKGVESALLRLNRWVLQCVHRGKAKKS